MALTFPASPTTGQTYTYNGETYEFDGKRWRVQVSAGSGSGTGVAVGKNLIINGDMQVAQRSTSYLYTGNGYSYNAIDRWGNYYNGLRIQQLERGVDGTYKKVMRITAETLVNNLYTYQFIENFGKIVGLGQVFSVSFKARASKSIGITAQMRYGPASGATAQENTLGSVTATTAWQTFKIENISHTTTETHGGLWLWGQSVDVALGDWIEITDVKVELGETATEFVSNSYAEELALCQRYFYKYNVNEYWAYPDSSNSGVVSSPNSFPVVMRVAPTCSSFTFSHVNGGYNVTRTPWTVTPKGISSLNYTGINTFGDGRAGWNTTPITCDAEL